MSLQITIRNAKASDLDAIIAMDEVVNDDRAGFWHGIFDHYVTGRVDRIFLVAENENTLMGFVVGEVRAWEFGSPASGWVFALTVSPSAREQGIGRQLFEEICKRLKEAGVSTVRTMVDLDNKLTLSFFRSLGLRTGRYIELEKQID